MQFSIDDRKNERLGEEASGDIACETLLPAVPSPVSVARGSATGAADESGGLVLEVVTTVDALAGLRGDYERLQLSTGNPLPFALSARTVRRLKRWRAMWRRLIGAHRAPTA